MSHGDAYALKHLGPKCGLVMCRQCCHCGRLLCSRAYARSCHDHGMVKQRVSCGNLDLALARFCLQMYAGFFACRCMQVVFHSIAVCIVCEILLLHATTLTGSTVCMCGCLSRVCAAHMTGVLLLAFVFGLSNLIATSQGNHHGLLCSHHLVMCLHITCGCNSRFLAARADYEAFWFAWCAVLAV